MSLAIHLFQDTFQISHRMDILTNSCAIKPISIQNYVISKLTDVCPGICGSDKITLSQN